MHPIHIKKIKKTASTSYSTTENLSYLFCVLPELLILCTPSQIVCNCSDAITAPCSDSPNPHRTQNRLTQCIQAYRPVNQLHTHRGTAKKTASHQKKTLCSRPLPAFPKAYYISTQKCAREGAVQRAASAFGLRLQWQQSLQHLHWHNADLKKIPLLLLKFIFFRCFFTIHVKFK